MQVIRELLLPYLSAHTRAIANRHSPLLMTLVVSTCVTAHTCRLLQPSSALVSMALSKAKTATTARSPGLIYPGRKRSWWKPSPRPHRTRSSYAHELASSCLSTATVFACEITQRPSQHRQKSSPIVCFGCMCYFGAGCGERLLCGPVSDQEDPEGGRDTMDWLR